MQKDYKLYVLLGYIFTGFLGLIFVFLYKEDPEDVRKHYKQAGAAFLTAIAANICLSIVRAILPLLLSSMFGILNTLLSFGILALCIIAGVKYYTNGENFKIPVIYEISESLFKN